VNLPPVDPAYTLFINHAQAIFDRFPNQQVFEQGGLRPNPQLRRPEAGYALALRYPAPAVAAIARFLDQMYAVLPPCVEYGAPNLHTTLGVYGKTALPGFAPAPETLRCLAAALAAGLAHRPPDLQIRFGPWLYNAEAVIIAAYPDPALWQLFQALGRACQAAGCPLEMSWGPHLTAARFIAPLALPAAAPFMRLMQSAPLIAPARPSAIDLVTWTCNGHKFELLTHAHAGL
jgi:hypothetical protein